MNLIILKYHLLQRVNLRLTLTLCISIVFLNSGLGQTLNITKTASTTNPDAGVPFSYIINASCNSSTRDCESVVLSDVIPTELEFLNFSDPLPDGVGSATYDATSRTATITFDASSCSTCTPDGINTDNDDFAQGSTVQLEIQVRFPSGTLDGTTANNTINATSNNAGSPSASAQTVTSNNGTSPETGCNQIYTEVDAASEVGEEGLSWISFWVANQGVSDINNYIADFYEPSNWNFEFVVTPEINGLDHTGYIYYERSDSPGSWILWTDFNTLNDQHLYESDLGLPSGVEVSGIRLDMGTLSGDGTWNRESFVSGWDSRLRLYGSNFGLLGGDSFTSCINFSGEVDGVNCNENECDDTNIIATEPLLDGNKSIHDLNEIEKYTFSPGDTMLVGITFASDEANDEDVIGGVLVDLLPPGVTYVPGSWYYAWDPGNIQNQNPVVETGYDVSGRQWVRFVYDSSLGNEFTITPDGSWIGFGIYFQAVVGQGVSQGTHTNDYYYTTTGSDHGCDYGETNGNLSVFGGYQFGSRYCSRPENFEIIRAPGSAGLDSYKEVKGTLNANYNRYPDVGTTVPGGQNDYKIVLSNPNSTPIDNITIIDIFPVIGDTEILNTSAPRSTLWRPSLLEPISSPTGTTVHYTTVSNPCRDELASPSDPLPFPSGCSSANWNTTPPSDITTVTGIKLELGSTTLNQGDTYELEWEMRAPADAPSSGEVAWNSFAFIADNATTGTRLLPAEPIKVGIESFPNAIPIVGDYVWIDTNGNGIQDSFEPGQDGVTVSLMYDSNGNGTADGGDTEYMQTVTSNGGQYLFSNFPLGDYYIQFSNLPAGYQETNSNAGDDDLDSDGLISDVITFTSTSDIRNIDLGLYLGEPPSLCEIRATIDSPSGCTQVNSNGGFEDSGTVVFNTTYQGIPAAEFTSYGNDIVDWTVQPSGSGTSYLINDSGNQVNNPEGDKFYFISTSGWCVSQEVNLVAGQCYDLDFWVAFYNSVGGSSVDIKVEVFDSDSNTGLDDIFSQTLTSSTSLNIMNWENINFSFTANTTETVYFYFTLGNPVGTFNGGIALDDFNLTECCAQSCPGGSLTLNTSAIDYNCLNSSLLEYEWSTGETTSSIVVSPSANTTYTVTVTDCNACSVVSSIDVSIYNISCNATLVQAPTCNGASDGSATVTVADATGNITYTWDNGEDTATAIGLTAGDHSVTVTDEAGCETTCSVKIPDTPALVYTDSWDYTCGDDTYVEILATGIKNNLPSTITIPNPSDVFKIVAEATFTRTDNNECVEFTSNIENIFASPEDLANFNCNHGYVYRAEMSPANYVTINANNDQWAQGFILYVFRSGPAYSNMISQGDLTSTCLRGETICKNYILPSQFVSRDIEITVPLAEITDDGRIARVTATACGATFTETIDNYNSGNSVALVNFTLANVDGNCTDLEICVESPSSSGQSLYLSGAISFETECYDCIPLTDGGQIGYDQNFCGSIVDPDEIVSLSLPSGIDGIVEYIWMESTSTCTPPTSVSDSNWSVIPGEVGATFDPEEIECNTCYVRLARNYGCEDYEFSNVVSMTIERQIMTNRFISYRRG